MPINLFGLTAIGKFTLTNEDCLSAFIIDARMY